MNMYSYVCYDVTLFFLASFPGLQFLIACSMHTARDQKLEA